jgi:DNA repair protein RadC
MSTLFVADSAGKYVPADDQVVVSAAQQAVERIMNSGLELDDRDKVRQYLVPLIGAEPTESFWVLHLNGGKRVIALEKNSEGSFDSTKCEFRKLIRSALDRNSEYIVVAHNHPSGGTEPSEPDIESTIKLGALLSVIDITLVDSLIVAGNKVSSIRDHIMQKAKDAFLEAALAKIQPSGKAN